MSAFRALSWSLDGTMLAVGTVDGRIMVFEGSSGELLWTRQGHSQIVRTLAFHPDGKRLATGGNDTLLHVWDISTGDRIATLQPHDNKVTIVAYSLDGQHLFSGSSDSSIQITDSHTFERIGQFVGHDWTILELGISKAHNDLISLCRGGEVRWWPISDFNITHHRIMAGGPVSALAINADATQMGFSNYRQQLTVIDAATRSTLWSVPDVGAVVGGLLFDRERLFVSCHDRHVRSYNSETGKLLWVSTQFAAPPTRFSVMLPLVRTPPLFTTISMPPYSLTVSAITVFIRPPSDTSPGQKRALPPTCSTILTVSFPFASVGDVPATTAPSLANITAIAWPSPEPNPVTNATFPCSFICASSENTAGRGPVPV
jgi:WD40 repeat protein